MKERGETTGNLSRKPVCWQKSSACERGPKKRESEEKQHFKKEFNSFFYVHPVFNFVDSDLIDGVPNKFIADRFSTLDGFVISIRGPK